MNKTQMRKAALETLTRYAHYMGSRKVKLAERCRREGEWYDEAVEAYRVSCERYGCIAGAYQDIDLFTMEETTALCRRIEEEHMERAYQDGRLKREEEMRT